MEHDTESVRIFCSIISKLETRSTECWSSGDGNAVHLEDIVKEILEKYGILSLT